jgi:para-aminobenzoate synthetase component 1
MANAPGFQTCMEMMNQLGSEEIPFVFLIDFEMRKPLLWRMDEPQDEFLFDFGDFAQNTRRGQIQKMPVVLHKEPVTAEEYERRFAIATGHIRNGDSYLVNITAPSRVRMNADIESLFQLADSRYVCMLRDEFVCFSPETFLRIRDSKIHAYPMKGTIDAGLPDAEKTILADPKEAAEHATIVDLIRNDLSIVARNVKVDRYRYYEVIRTHDKILGQVSSEITGELEEGFHKRIGDIIFGQLPAGSVSGAPKKKTVEIIREAEGEDRGYYTGIAGCFRNRELESCVLIRYVSKNGIYRSGGGITSMSRLASEYQEMIDKVYVPLH